MPGSLLAEVHQPRGLIWFVCLSVRMMCKWQEKVLALMWNSLNSLWSLWNSLLKTVLVKVLFEGGPKKF